MLARVSCSVSLRKVSCTCSCSVCLFNVHQSEHSRLNLMVCKYASDSYYYLSGACQFDGNGVSCKAKLWIWRWWWLFVAGALAELFECKHIFATRNRMNGANIYLFGFNQITFSIGMKIERGRESERAEERLYVAETKNSNCVTPALELIQKPIMLSESIHIHSDGARFTNLHISVNQHLCTRMRQNYRECDKNEKNRKNLEFPISGIRWYDDAVVSCVDVCAHKIKSVHWQYAPASLFRVSTLLAPSPCICLLPRCVSRIPPLFDARLFIFFAISPFSASNRARITTRPIKVCHIFARANVYTFFFHPTGFAFNPIQRFSHILRFLSLSIVQAELSPPTHRAYVAFTTIQVCEWAHIQARSNRFFTSFAFRWYFQTTINGIMCNSMKSKIRNA